MAVYISSSKSNTLEPLRKNRWVISFTNVPGSGKNDELSFAAHTAAQPQITFNAVEQHRMNERTYVAGKPTYNQIPLGFYDFIRGDNSAGDILYNWANSIYNPITGQMFFKSQYTTSATIGLLDPSGGVVRLWNLFYCWISEINFNDLSSEDDALTDVTCTLHYDYAIKASDVNTDPNPK